MTRKEFIGVFIPLMSYHNKSLDEMVLNLYFNSFCHVEIDVFSKAVSRITKRMKFFPKISEIMEIIEGNEDDQKAIAWQFVLEHLPNATRMTTAKPAPVGVHETVQRMGGWSAVGLWKIESLDFIKKDFWNLFTSDEYRPLLSSELKNMLPDLPSVDKAINVQGSRYKSVSV